MGWQVSLGSAELFFWSSSFMCLKSAAGQVKGFPDPRRSLYYPWGLSWENGNDSYLLHMECSLINQQAIPHLFVRQ